MKTQNKTSLLLALTLGISFLGSIPLAAKAQDDSLLADTEEILDSTDPIDVDGTHHRPSEADRMAKMRKNLEAKNEDLVRKKIEDMRMKEEMRMTKRLSNAFSGGLNNTDEVKTVQAAPQVVAPAPTPAPVQSDTEFAGIKLIPNFGMLSIKGDKIDFESKFNGGIMAEAMIVRNVSIGVGFNYATLDLVDLDGNSFTNGYGSYYNAGYYNYYGQGRELSYKHFNLEINSKFFLTTESRIRPYAGLGLGVNKTKLSYTESSKGYYNSTTTTQFGDEDYSATYLSGIALVGAEAIFTKNVGMNLDFRYSHGLTGVSENEASLPSFNPDQEKLTKIGGAIEKSNFFSVNLGLIVSF